jgi:hypothetical protein
MKIRISGNTIRFRLKQPEVESFAKTGLIADEINFGKSINNRLTFELRTNKEQSFTAYYQNNLIAILIPEKGAEEWTTTSLVGIEGKVITGDTILHVLIEKDFACLDRNDADNEGTYPNPLANCLPANADNR